MAAVTKFDLCYYGQVNSLRLKSNAASKWAKNTFKGNIYFAGDGTLHKFFSKPLTKTLSPHVLIPVLTIHLHFPCILFWLLIIFLGWGPPESIHLLYRGGSGHSWRIPKGNWKTRSTSLRRYSFLILDHQCHDWVIRFITITQTKNVSSLIQD